MAMEHFSHKKSAGTSFAKRPLPEFEERIIQVDRVTYVVAGGKRLRFRVLVVIGDRKGRVGYGIGKATEVPVSVKKAVSQAKKNLIKVAIVKNTIPHEIKYKFGAAYIFLKPAREGTSIIAGGSVRAVLELAGIKNILSKIIGSANKINNVKATINALKSLKAIAPKAAIKEPVINENTKLPAIKPVAKKAAKEPGKNKK